MDDDESETESESDSEPEPAPPGEEMSPVETGKDEELLPPGVEAEAPSIDEDLLPPGQYHALDRLLMIHCQVGGMEKWQETLNFLKPGFTSLYLGTFRF